MRQPISTRKHIWLRSTRIHNLHGGRTLVASASLWATRETERSISPEVQYAEWKILLMPTSVPPFPNSSAKLGRVFLVESRVLVLRLLFETGKPHKLCKKGLAQDNTKGARCWELWRVEYAVWVSCFRHFFTTLYPRVSGLRTPQNLHVWPTSFIPNPLPTKQVFTPVPSTYTYFTMNTAARVARNSLTKLASRFVCVYCLYVGKRKSGWFTQSCLSFR